MIQQLTNIHSKPRIATVQTVAIRGFALFHFKKYPKVWILIDSNIWKRLHRALMRIQSLLNPYALIDN